MIDASVPEAAGGAARREIWALVPVKAFRDAKQRLSADLAAPRRAAFARAMAARVIGTLRGEPMLAGVAVVTGDDEVAAFARSLGAESSWRAAPTRLSAR